MNDLVSIIIPVHNAEKFISDTVATVKSQTYKNWELILVDDGSTDNSLQIITDYESRADNIKVIHLDKASGAANARNQGNLLSKGRYITFLDADDLWDPEKLELQIAFMEENDCGFSYTNYEFADEDGVGIKKIVSVPEKLVYKQALKNTTIFTSTVMFDLEKIPKELTLMPNVPSEDTATWWQVLRAGYTAYGLKRSLTIYRRSGHTLSSNKIEAIKRAWNLYRNVEHLSLPYSCICFASYAIHAVWRRI